MEDVREEEITRAGAGVGTSEHHVLNVDERSQKPIKPLSFLLCFNNLTYSVKVRPKFTFSSLIARRTAEPEKRTILNSISGEARDGEILAILGASGSGKTTLLDALANRIEKESLKGTVSLNGEVLESRLWKAIVAYVMQDDLLFPMLTVEETLGFAAEFRLPRTLEESKKKARVQDLIDQLGLRSAAKTIIGDEGRRGVSGGERRRVSIGIDIIHGPILLFLDEPTSGLDSTSAFTVVNVLKNIARGGSVVVMSVHQPSYRIIGLLDKLIFLSKGQVVYRGSPINLPLFCSKFGRPIPDNANPVEFMLDLISELEDSTNGISTLVDLNNTGKSSERADAEKSDVVSSLTEALNLGISKGKLVSDNINTSNVKKTFANPFWTEMLVLYKRSMTNSRRTPEIFAARLITILTTGFLLATIYWQLDDSPKGIRERLGFFAFAISSTYFSSCQYLPVFLQERFIFMRETAYNAYRRSSYVLSHAFAVLLPLFILSLAFSMTTFWAVGLTGGISGFLFYFLIIYASFWAGNSFAVFVSGLVPHILLGYTVVIAVSAYFLLLSGFFINRNRIPPYWIWFHYVSLIKYPYEALMRSEFDDPTKCFRRGSEMFDDTPFRNISGDTKERMLGSLSASSGTNYNVTSSTCLTTGLDVLKEQGITDLNKWMYLLIIVAWGFFYRFLFYLSLLLGSKNKRK
ncbi:ABC transporter G family member 6 [Morus notabilis]|uniref:ABC transporter G family member 6 n=1 Tax=Morus notabilis TaxID=981085 RepID=W9RAL7_9ROSA|nr:ABC transporter G family member 6 [Morus notabilis]EXB65354.1 ABC transporter G family member 6 [Morus notabilis]